MLILGVAALGHDASVALASDDGDILFAAHAERYSRVKNDARLNRSIATDALRYGTPDLIVWYENPILRLARQIWAGQWDAVKDYVSPAAHLRSVGLGNIPIAYVGHHESHAAAGYFTSPFDHAAVLVIDAIGEWATTSLWEGRGNSLRKLWSQSYPHSLGLFYSAFTQRCGLKPNEEEYIMMGMAAYGRPTLIETIKNDLIEPVEAPAFRLKENLHRGVRWWRPEETDAFSIAASAQSITEEYLIQLVKWAHQKTGARNLVLMGGVALNCVANSKIAKTRVFDDIWIMPNPGDAGSSIGAIAAKLRRKLKWTSPYLGYDIARQFDMNGALDALLTGRVIGIANGRAEFGPRALGNRSLLCDPRGPGVKDLVNDIKKRERFRPFAPIVLEEHADEHFDMPIRRSPYMQFVAQVKSDRYPAITHIDGTARVQTLSRDQNPRMYDLLHAFYERTGCPMLLNTSLNIKSEPLVNDWDDALRFAALHDVPIF